jgi:hypothetical protein
VLKRFWKYRNQKRSDIPEGCSEKIDFRFLWVVWTYPNKRRLKAFEVTNLYKDKKKVIILSDCNQVVKFISKLKEETSNYGNTEVDGMQANMII